LNFGADTEKIIVEKLTIGEFYGEFTVNVFSTKVIPGRITEKGGNSNGMV
jgi:hypothetical protein